MSITINGSGTITGISAGGLPDGSITNDDLAGSITDAKLSGTTCKAFVNFDGTGTPAIRAQFNVSSITDNGTGDYTVNFATALADANYVVSGTAMRQSDNLPNGNAGMDLNLVGNSTYSNTFSTASVRVMSKLDNGNIEDALSVCVLIFR
jgi:hypothetical protein